MAESNRAVFKIEIDGSAEDVWREITRTEGLNAAFFNMKMVVDRFEPGGQLRMRRFVHTFKFTQFDDPPCTMVYELAPKGTSVVFTLTAQDIPAGTRTAKQLTSGGKMITNTVKAIVESGRPSFGTRMLYRLFKVLTPLTRKKCRTENWPI